MFAWSRVSRNVLCLLLFFQRPDWQIRQLSVRGQLRCSCADFNKLHCPVTPLTGLQLHKLFQSLIFPIKQCVKKFMITWIWAIHVTHCTWWQWLVKTNSWLSSSQPELFIRIQGAEQVKVKSQELWSQREFSALPIQENLWWAICFHSWVTRTHMG